MFKLETRSPQAALPLLPLAIANLPRAVSEALQQAGVPTVTHSSRQPMARFVLADRRQGGLPSVNAAQTVIDLGDLSAQAIADLDDEQSVRRAWPMGSWTVHEQVARVDKRHVARELLADIQRCVEQHGGIWLQIAPVPAPYRTAFNLRADHDAYVPQDFTNFCAAIAGHEQAVSHFVCAGGFVDHAHMLAYLQGQDIGSHGYWHHTYRDVESNRRNLMRGIDCLRLWGIEPSGFVAPHGRFQRNLQCVLDELAISHSGEFSFCYHDWPRYPRDSKVLQIPVSPICLGIVLEAQRAAGQTDEHSCRRAVEVLTEHFCAWAQALHAAGEPIFLYGHPDERLGRYPQIVRRLLATIDALGNVWCVSQTEFARWWRARQEVRFRVWREAGRLQIECDQLPHSYTAAIDLHDARGVARVPLTTRRQSVALDELSFETRVDPPLLQSWDVPPSTAIHSSLRTWLDWELVTPIREIDTRTWQGWFKRSLRVVRDRQRRAA